MDLQPMTTSYCRHSPFLSRTGNVLHSSRESTFVCLLFNKVEEVQHSIVIPSDSHSGINYPPFANADGFETTDCLECLQILNILIYGRRVYFKAGDWILCTMIGYRIPERETFRMLPLISFCILTFCKKRTFCFIPVICKDCTILSREWHNHFCGLMICFKAE